MCWFADLVTLLSARCKYNIIRRVTGAISCTRMQYMGHGIHLEEATNLYNFFFFVKANGNTDFGDVCTSMDGGTISKHI